MSITLALGRWKLGKQQFKVILGSSKTLFKALPGSPGRTDMTLAMHKSSSNKKKSSESRVTRTVVTCYSVKMLMADFIPFFEKSFSL